MSEDPKLFVHRMEYGTASPDWSFSAHPEEAEFNLFRYCHNDPLDFTDPMGLDMAIAIGTMRDDWKWIPNPLGHASMAVTGQGTFSEATLTNQGSAFTRFLAEQQLHRGTTVYIVRTTPEQDKAVAKEAAAQHAKGELPNILSIRLMRTRTIVQHVFLRLLELAVWIWVIRIGPVNSNIS